MYTMYGDGRTDMYDKVLSLQKERQRERERERRRKILYTCTRAEKISTQRIYFTIDSWLAIHLVSYICVISAV